MMRDRRDRGPGKTSLLDIGGGGISLQTELCADPARVRSIAVYRGRVIRRIDLPLEGEAAAGDLDELVATQHARLEESVRQTMTSLGSRRAPGTGPSAVALLFVKAVEAYAAGESGTALLVLEALEALGADDPRVRASLARLRVGASDDLVHFAAAEEL